ncbi:MAG: TatD family hydrolase [Patescibacteria group bacterium]|nr:TatD family hydrolase [Patescibacteria group bacterium]
MKLIDSHVHLDMEPLSEELSLVVERASKAGVTEMINIGSSLRGSERSVEIAESYPNIWATVGLHPHEAGEILDFPGTMEKIEELVGNDQVVGIGEIGLDYYGMQNTKGEQKELFVAQLELAKRLKLPVVVHIRDAWDDFFRVITDYKLSGVVHCYTGDEKIAKKVIEAGYFLGFTGFVTFGQAKFDHIREAVKVTPLDHLLIETDAPFLAPEPYRGKPNEPAFVTEVAKKIAEIKKVTVEEVADKSRVNTHKLFGLTSSA